MRWFLTASVGVDCRGVVGGAASSKPRFSCCLPAAGGVNGGVGVGRPLGGDVRGSDGAVAGREPTLATDPRGSRLYSWTSSGAVVSPPPGLPLQPPLLSIHFFEATTSAWMFVMPAGA